MTDSEDGHALGTSAPHVADDGSKGAVLRLLLRYLENLAFFWISLVVYILTLDGLLQGPRLDD